MECHISKIQAKSIAFQIYKDIGQYLDNHKQEFEEFLKTEADMNDGEKTQEVIL